MTIDALVLIVFFAALIPIMGALAARLRGRGRLAFLLSGVVPLVVLVALVFGVRIKGIDGVTPVELVLAATPVAALLASVAGWLSGSGALLFWSVFAVNAAMVACFGYFAFIFHIF
ncbi:MAG: hypothetical protein ACRD4Y_11905 [Candidatus Acidiferrales bacterium]